MTLQDKLDAYFVDHGAVPFCSYCGALIPPREGEGTCPRCDPEGCAAHAANLRDACADSPCNRCGGSGTDPRSNRPDDYGPHTICIACGGKG